MSVSTDAILFYGYCWKDEGDSIDTGGEDGDGWVETILKKRAERNPWDDYPESISQIRDYGEKKRAGDEWIKANRAALDAWNDKKKAVEDEFGVELDSHCSGEYPIPYLYVKDGRAIANRGYPQEVTNLRVQPEWDEMLNKWLAEFRIDKPHDAPRWWLVSYWG